MTRAVIKLAGDISYVMPVLDRVIESYAYNTIVPVAGFRYKNFGVIIHSHDILVINAGDEASALEVMNFIKDIVINADEITEKVRTY